MPSRARAEKEATLQGECDKPPPPLPSSFDCLRSVGNLRALPGHRPHPVASTPQTVPVAELHGGTMQITLKTLQQQTFKIDIDPEETVRAAGSAGPGTRQLREWPARPRRRSALRGLSWGPGLYQSGARRRARAGRVPGVLERAR